MLLFLIFLANVYGEKATFSGRLQFNDSQSVVMHYPSDVYGLVNNITYNVSVLNDYNGMIVMRLSRMHNIVGANFLSGVLYDKNVTCEFVCPVGWLTSTMSHVEFDSLGFTNLSYTITVDYDNSWSSVMTGITIVGSILACFLFLLLLVVLRRYRRNRQSSFQTLN